MTHTLIGVQYLRAIAALAVVFVHIRVPIERVYGVTSWPEWFSGGVDLFFVISGFIMWVTTADNDMAPARFYWRRLTRIVPLYWTITLFLVLAGVAAPQIAQTVSVEPGFVLSSLLFVPAMHPNLGTLHPVIIAGWTINYEMFFYLLFGLALFIGNRRLRLAAIFSALGALVALGGLFPDPRTLANFYTSPMLLEFGFGIAVGAMVTSARRFPVWACLVGAATALVGMTAIGPNLPGVHRAFAAGLPAALLLYCVVQLERSGNMVTLPFLRLLGDSSYSLYLVHGIALSAVTVLWSRMIAVVDLGPGALMIAALVSSVAAGLASFYLIEKPAMALIRAFEKRRRAAARS